MFFYRAHGLVLKSELELPELAALEEAAADVEIRRGPVDAPKSETEAWCRGDLAELTAVYRGVGGFRLQRGRAVTYNDSGSPERLRLFFLGSVMALLLAQRGWFALHAGAVAIEGKAVALAGIRGAGKSTTTAALVRRGHPLLADDVTAVLPDGRVPGAYPFMRLWPAALELLGESGEHPRLAPDYDKRLFRTAVDPEKSLGCVVLLEAGEQLAWEKLSPMEATMGLLSHSYNARWGRAVMADAMAEANFLSCTKLARSVPVFRVVRPVEPQMLAPTLDLVEEVAQQ